MQSFVCIPTSESGLPNMPLAFKTLPNFALQHPQEAGNGAKNVSDANTVTLPPLKGSFIREFN